MKELIFPPCDFRYSESGQKKLIFDVIRKKFIPLTPEEWVRQHVVHYLIQHKHCPASGIAVERELKYNGLKKRFDIMVFAGGHPFCIIECKAPEVLLTPNTVLQAGVYNTRFNCPWLMVTNGLATHWFYFNGQRLEPAQEPDWT